MISKKLLAEADELCRLGVAELGAGFAAGKFTPLEVAKATLARAEVVQERYNAFSLIDTDMALTMAKESTARWRNGAPSSPIDGVPTTVKDIVWVKDRAIRYGSRTTSTEPCVQDAPSVKRLRAAGAILIGLTTTPEFGWKAITESPLTGVTRNPWNPQTTPGGSSGGAVVAAVAGAGVLHIGTDGGGSVRIPSSFTGVFDRDISHPLVCGSSEPLRRGAERPGELVRSRICRSCPQRRFDYRLRSRRRAIAPHRVRRRHGEALRQARFHRLAGNGDPGLFGPSRGAERCRARTLALCQQLRFPDQPQPAAGMFNAMRPDHGRPPDRPAVRRRQGRGRQGPLGGA